MADKTWELVRVRGTTKTRLEGMRDKALAQYDAGNPAYDGLANFVNPDASGRYPQRLSVDAFLCWMMTRLDGHKERSKKAKAKARAGKAAKAAPAAACIQDTTTAAGAAAE